MTDGVKISLLDPLTVFTGAEEFPLVVGGANFRGNVLDLGNYLVTALGLNRPPLSQSFSQSGVDTTLLFEGNVLSGASDPDGDPLTIQGLTYNGVVENFQAGSFVTTYGVFFLNPTSGDWSFTLGQAARKLTTGQTGVETFVYTLGDGRGGLVSHPIVLTIIGTNSAPIVNYLNASTPVNVTGSGNLITNLIFDYETTPTIASYSIAGITGTWAAGTTQAISGKGSITINADGSWAFVPATDFTGPIPLITTTVTDGVNNVPGYLTIAVTPPLTGTAPIIRFTDVVAGPISGGENNQGIPLTLWGVNFGLSSGLGTTTKVFIGGVEVAHYYELVDDQLASRFPGMQRLCVQVGAIGSPTLGKPLPITVSVGGVVSNADCVFTPNPGNIYFVSLSGNDLTGVAGDITKPFRTLQTPTRGGIYALLRAGDTIIIRGGAWSDIGYDSAWFRFRDPAQQGSNPSGASGTGWITLMPYPGETVHYTNPSGGTKGGIQGPGQAFTGTTGDWVVISKLEIEVVAGSTRDAGPVNMQYNTGHWRIVGNNLGPWVAGSSPILNAACVTGEGDFIYVLGNYCHDIEGTTDLQNHGLYAGTNSYGWEVAWNWWHNCVGGSAIQFNDSDGGTGTFETPFGIWNGFENILVHHNFIEVTAKYGVNFADIGANGGLGNLSAKVWNNVIIGTGLAPLRLNTNTGSSDVLYAFNTTYDCNRTSNAGNAILRNEGNQNASTHSVKAYDNIFALGPNSVTTDMHWMYDASGESTGYDLQRNVYWANGVTIANATDSLAIYGDPKFTSVASGALDLSLQASSPAVNAGTKALPNLIVNDDVTGLASRQLGGAPDCGAYERGQTTPYVVTTPSFSGGPQIGVATTVTVGTWGNSPTSYSRQFTVNGFAAGSPITGTGTASHTWAPGDEREACACEVSATNGSGTTTYTLAIGTVAVGVGAPVNTVAPSFTGTAQAGSTLSGSAGTWTGTVDSYSYVWTRDGTLISGATSINYTLTGSDVGHSVTLVVYANNSVTGSQVASSTPSGTVSPAPADPQFVQSTTATLAPGSSTNVVGTFGSSVTGGNWIIGFSQMRDQKLGNCTISDTQSHTTSSFTLSPEFKYNSDNPWIGSDYIQSTATGSYTQTVASGSSAGGSMVFVEVTGTDPTSFLDIPSDKSEGSGTAVTLSGSTANTKHNDLILVLVATVGAGHTVTAGSGWTAVANIDGTYDGLFVFQRKCTAVETFAFTATIDATTGWIAQSLVIKGS